MTRAIMPLLVRAAAPILLATLALAPVATAPAQLIISDAPRMDIQVDLRVGRTWIYRTRAEHTRTLREAGSTSTERREESITWLARSTRAIDAETVEVRASIVLLDLSAEGKDAALRVSARNPAHASLYSTPGRSGARTAGAAPLDRALAQTTFRFHVGVRTGVARLASISGPLPKALAALDRDALGIASPLQPGALSSTFTSLWNAESMLADNVRLNSTWRVQLAAGAAPAGRIVWTYDWTLKAGAGAFAIMDATAAARLVQTWRPHPGDSAVLRAAGGSATTLWDTASDALAERTERRTTTIDWRIGGREITETQTHTHRVERRG